MRLWVGYGSVYITAKIKFLKFGNDKILIGWQHYLVLYDRLNVLLQKKKSLGILQVSGAQLVKLLVVEPTHTGSNSKFDTDARITVNYSFGDRRRIHR